MPAPAFTALTVDELRARREQLTLVDVRSPGEFASGHVPGAHNIPLDQLDRALPALRDASDHGELALICASGSRSQNACQRAAGAGVRAFTVTGGTDAWARAGNPVDRVEDVRPVWPMDRQVRLVAGSLVLAGLAADLVVPGFRLLSAAIGAGLVFSAVTNTCAMASMLGKLPYNRRAAAGYDLDAAVAGLRN
ncbi:MAG: rhodanese-like domain-containing protein [Streptosporangiales bacterium]|nr:rhodanese-like domain-containing protein [Streptosporangiales bacterium]